MPVHKNHRFVHIHIPKTGGTAIGREFERLGDMEWNPTGWYGQTRHDDRWYEYHHLTAMELCELSAGEFSTYSSFAMVRDPYQRLISEYCWRSSLTVADPDTFLRPFDSFDAMVKDIPTDIADNWSAHIADADMAQANFLIHTRPQYHYVLGPDGHRDDSIEILRSERLREGVDSALARAGEESHAVNESTPVRPLADWYTDEALAIVNQIYRLDFDWFSYPMVDSL